MMQKHKILITLTGATAVVDSNLQNVNGYEVNYIQGFGGGIVNYSNIRNFLNDEVNLSIINDFFSYLTGATTVVEFGEIYNSDQKLSDVFNNYYESSVLNNQFPPVEVIDNSLTGTTGITVINTSVFKYDGVAPSKGLNYIPLSINDATRDLKVFSALTTFTYEPSYYIPVFVKRNYSQTDRARVYFDNITEIIDELIPDLDNDTGGGDDYSDYENENNGPDDSGGQSEEDVVFVPFPGFFDQFIGGEKTPTSGTTESGSTPLTEGGTQDPPTVE